MCRYCSGGLVPFACEDPKLFRMLRELDLYLALGFLDRDLAGLGLTPWSSSLASPASNSRTSSLGGLLNLLSSFCLGTLNSLCQPRIGPRLTSASRIVASSRAVSTASATASWPLLERSRAARTALLPRGGLKLLSEALRFCAGVLCGFLGFACSDPGILTAAA